MKAYVDEDTCISCGLCASICEEVFIMGDSGKAETIVGEVPAANESEAKEAESSCPVDAIKCE